jgi:acetolactate synthase-1/2/3 large subunit
MDVGERLVELMVSSGVQTGFGVPGGQTAPYYHGMAVHQDEVQHVLMRDERSAVFAADAYARTAGKLAACDATVGPGATNLVSGLVEARAASIPMIAVVADIPRNWEHRRRMGNAAQGFEQRSFLEPCVKWFGRVEVPEAIDDVYNHAVRVANSGRPGPVVIEVPDDVFSAPVEETGVPGADARFPRSRTAPDPAAVTAAVRALASADRPVLFVGGGAHLSGAHAEVLALAERLQVPVVTTITGKGIVPETHRLAVGIVGSFGVPVANDVLGTADCVLAIGTKIGQAATVGYDLPASSALVIHLDIDAEEIGRNSRNFLPLEGDAKLGVQALLAAAVETAASTWNLPDLAARVEAWWAAEAGYKTPLDGDKAKPQEVVRALAGQIGEDDHVVTDASLSSGWAGTRWRQSAHGRRLLAPRGVAPLGWGLPAAVGTAFALKDIGSAGRTICLAGDGGWGYSLGEIETLTRFRMPVVSVVLNNSVLGWNKHVAMRRYPDAWVSQDFAEVDYAASAAALGASATRVNSVEEFEIALEKALSVEDRPSVVEVITSEFETPVIKAMSGAVASQRTSY